MNELEQESDQELKQKLARIRESKKKKIEIRVTSEDKEIITKNAKKLGLTPSVYLRDLGLKGYVLAKAEKPKADSSEAVPIFNAKLILAIGVNLNQIAKYINSTHQLHPELEEAIKAVNQVFKK